jgi:transporter family protein
MNNDYRLLLFSGLTVLMWGLWGFFGKLALERKMAPTTIFLAEVLISAACAVPLWLVLLKTQNAPSPFSSWNVFGLLSGAGLAIGLLFYYLALQGGQASVIVPLTSTYPIVAVLLSAAVLGERPSLTQWLGVILVVTGVTLLLNGPVAASPQR